MKNELFAALAAAAIATLTGCPGDSPSPSTADASGPIDASEVAAPDAAVIGADAAQVPDAAMPPDAATPVLGEISPAQLTAMLAAKDFLMIDVHVPYEGTIPGTDTSIPFSSVDALVACIGADLNRKVVLTCMSGGMSRIAGTALINRGYRNLSELTGGMRAWTNAGGTLELRDGGLPACP